MRIPTKNSGRAVIRRGLFYIVNRKGNKSERQEGPVALQRAVVRPIVWNLIEINRLGKLVVGWLSNI